MKYMFGELALAFNDDEIELVLPSEFFDLEYIHLLDVNGTERISIPRDYTWCKYVWETTLVLY